MLRRIALPLIFLLACSKDDEGPPPPPANEKVGDIRQNVTWVDGDKLVGVIRIFEGATVEIAPGAKIGCTDAVQILVGGTFRVKAAGNHAVINCPAWQGLLVAANGQVDVEGLDIENAKVGIESTAQAGQINVVESSFRNVTRPFLVRAESTVNATKVTITTPTTVGEFESSVTEVFGTFNGKYIDYEANTNEGIMALDDGTIDIEDSTMKGVNGQDLISGYGAKAVKIRYTTMRGAHCGPHIAPSKTDPLKPTGSVEIDHVTSEQNQFGITIYGVSAAGPNIVKDSNFEGDQKWLDLQGENGVITFQNIYTSDQAKVLMQNTNPQTFNHATAKVEGAGPR